MENPKLEVLANHPATIDRVLDGADALFWVAPPTPATTMDETYSGFTRPAAAAISRLGVAHVVAVTALGRGTEWQDKAGLVTASLRMINLLKDTGAAVRGLAMPGFMENALQQLDAIRQGAKLNLDAYEIAFASDNSRSMADSALNGQTKMQAAEPIKCQRPKQHDEISLEEWRHKIRNMR